MRVTPVAKWPKAIAAVLVFLTLTGCAGPSAERERQEPVTDDNADAVTFGSVIDGDTIETSAGTIRIIGIDTPERGQCGHDEASAAIGRLLAGGDRVVLSLPEGQNDRDRHGRLIRYVSTADGVDIGLMQLEAGHATARYDSSDGYPAHPREAAYHAAQVIRPGPDGSIVTLGCQAVPLATVPIVHGAWWEQYTSCAKLKKNTVGDPTGPFARDEPAQAEIYDWFANRTGNQGDGDQDGLACEG
jgi:endonuclease YncB( thermonuclease family)